MKRYRVIFFLLFFWLTETNGQQDYYFLIPDDYISKECDLDFFKIEQLISRGEATIAEARDLENKLSVYEKNQGRNSLRKMQLKERIYRQQLKASTYFEDAFRKQYRLLKRCLRKKFPNEYVKIEGEIRKHFQSASVLRKEAINSVPARSPLDFMADASVHEKQALELMRMAFVPEGQLLSLSGEAVINADSSGIIVNAINPMEETEIPLKPDSLYAVEDRITEESGPKVFFSIQFLATREPVSESQIRKVYNGCLSVIDNYSSGWYRFSAGKFDDISEAEQKMQEERISGFIVAFRNDERISLAEAGRLLKD